MHALAFALLSVDEGQSVMAVAHRPAMRHLPSNASSDPLLLLLPTPLAPPQAYFWDIHSMPYFIFVMVRACSMLFQPKQEDTASLFYGWGGAEMPLLEVFPLICIRGP